MIGDVSGHGYQAALIMALTMSASAIHAQTHRRSGRDAARAAVHRCAKSSTTTEMFISAFYAVVDPASRRAALREHRPSARVRRLAEAGDVERLAASDPPLGMTDAGAAHRPSRRGIAGRDLLVLFTDGVSDARNREGDRASARSACSTRFARIATRAPAQILERVFDAAGRAHRRRAAPRRPHARSSRELSGGDRRRARGGRARRDLPPTRKSLGQHFLNDRRILERIADALELTGAETVIEIGPGRGSLTELLVPARRTSRAIEYDRALAERAARAIRDDAIASRSSRRTCSTVDLGELAGGPYRARRQRAVLHHDADPLSRARASASRARRVSRAARGRAIASSRAPGTQRVRRAVGERAGRARRRRCSFASRPDRFSRRRRWRARWFVSSRAPSRSSTPTKSPRFARFVQDAFGMRRKQMRRVVRSALRARRAEDGRCAARRGRHRARRVAAGDA